VKEERRQGPLKAEWLEGAEVATEDRVGVRLSTY
jgi:hypothetical protein